VFWFGAVLWYSNWPCAADIDEITTGNDDEIAIVIGIGRTMIAEIATEIAIVTGIATAMRSVIANIVVVIIMMRSVNLLDAVHHHHHYHYFHFASLHVSSTQLTFTVNPSHHSLPHLFGQISHIFMTISGLTAHWFLFCFSLHFFLFDSCDRLSWLNQLLNCTLNPCTFLSFLQGDYWSGKPEDVGEFDSCHRNVSKLAKSQGSVGGKPLSG